MLYFGKIILVQSVANVTAISLFIYNQRNPAKGLLTQDGFYCLMISCIFNILTFNNINKELK